MIEKTIPDEILYTVTVIYFEGKSKANVVTTSESTRGKMEITSGKL